MQDYIQTHRTTTCSNILLHDQIETLAVLRAGKILLYRASLVRVVYWLIRSFSSLIELASPCFSLSATPTDDLLSARIFFRISGDDYNIIISSLLFSVLLLNGSASSRLASRFFLS
jgi:hypothetical protein